MKNKISKRWMIWGPHFSKQDHHFMFHPDDKLYFCHLSGMDINIEHIDFLENAMSTIPIQYIQGREVADMEYMRPSDRHKAQLKLDESYFRNVLDELDIDVFYSYGTSRNRPFLIDARNVLLNAHFDKVLSLWGADPLLNCRSLDWMGTLEYGTTAQIRTENIPDIDDDQKDLLDKFMKVFVATKIDSKKICMDSNTQIKEEFKTTYPVAVVLVQAVGDTSLLIKSSARQFYDYTWIYDLIARHPDVFFIIKDHPDQHTVPIEPRHFTSYTWSHKEKGSNWLYLPPDSSYDTLALSMHADFAITFNSRAGLDTLYWTTLVAEGERYRHDSICYRLSDFHSTLQPKNKAHIRKFMYYLITRQLFIPGLNVNTDSFCDWLSWINQYRLSVGVDQQHPRQASMEELKNLCGGEFFFEKRGFPA